MPRPALSPTRTYRVDAELAFKLDEIKVAIRRLGEPFCARAYLERIVRPAIEADHARLCKNGDGQAPAGV